MAKRFLNDLNKCTGCQACMLACTIENGLEPGKSWRNVVTSNPGRLPEIPIYHLSLACNHCEDPACMRHCPALAYNRDEKTGIVTIDTEACIGCRYCTWACPYDAPRFDAARGVMNKCTFCTERVADERDPACVSVCPTGALHCVARDDPQGIDQVPGFPDTSIQPAIRFIPLHEERRGPEQSALPDVDAVKSLFDRSVYAPSSKITLKGEWPLVVFSLLAAGLVALVCADLLKRSEISLPAFLIAGLAGMALSTLHLGQKLRAPRAVFNLRHSWLSREIFLFFVFLALTATWLFTARSSDLLGGAAAITGILALIAMDKVYKITLKSSPIRGHSAGVLLTGLFWTGLFLAEPLLITFFGLVKLVHYIERKFHALNKKETIRPFLTLGRLGLGFALPFIFWRLDPQYGYVCALACFALGEVIDRCEFYMELEVESPARACVQSLPEPTTK